MNTIDTILHDAEALVALIQERDLRGAAILAERVGRDVVEYERDLRDPIYAARWRPAS